MPKKKKPGAEAVLSRARQMVRAEKRKLWEQLGFEGEFDEAGFVAKLAALKAGATTKPEGEADVPGLEDRGRGATVGGGARGLAGGGGGGRVRGDDRRGRAVASVVGSIERSGGE